MEGFVSCIFGNDGHVQRNLVASIEMKCNTAAITGITTRAPFYTVEVTLLTWKLGVVYNDSNIQIVNK